MFGPPASRPAILVRTLKVVVCIGVLSFAGAQWLSTRGLDRAALTRIAERLADEPLTTGSINGQRAAATRLDPCRMPQK